MTTNQYFSPNSQRCLFDMLDDGIPVNEHNISSTNSSSYLTPPSSPTFNRIDLPPTPTPNRMHSKSMLMTPQPRTQKGSHLIVPSSNINPFSPDKRFPSRRSSVPANLPSHQQSRYLIDFEILSRLGIGSFSEVFKCRHRVDGWLYAVKRAKQPFKSLTHKENTLKEVYALAALKYHSHIVRYYNSWVEDNRLFIQTEYCGGGSLWDLVQQLKKEQEDINSDFYPFTEAELCRILRHILKGLSHIHARGLAHLDVKPENIFLCHPDPCQEHDSKTLYKVGDLGLISVARTTCKGNPSVVEGDGRYVPPEVLAMVLDDDFESGGHNQDDEDMLLGSDDILNMGTFSPFSRNDSSNDTSHDLSHVPVESIDTHDYAKADIYSLGCSIYVVALGGDIEKYKAIKEGRMDLPEDVFSLEFRNMLAMMIRTNPKHRPSAVELLKQDILKNKKDEKIQRLEKKIQENDAIIGRLERIEKLLLTNNHSKRNERTSSERNLTRKRKRLDDDDIAEAQKRSERELIDRLAESVVLKINELLPKKLV